MGIARPLLKIAAACAVVLGGCAGGCVGGPRDSHAPIAAVGASTGTAAANAAADAALDWHPLLPAPFGTLLKDMPLALHEVLLFHDESQGSGDTDNKDCYASDRAPPAFLGAKPRVYRFCFTHDHFTRIEAIVDLPAAAAGATFVRACAVWRKRAPAAVPGTAPSGADVCDGQEVGMGYGAKLTPDAGGATTAASFTAFSVGDGAALDATSMDDRPIDRGTPADGGPGTPPHP